MMTKILFFGRLGDQFGREIDFELPADGCTAGELRDLLCERFPSTEYALRQPCVNVCLDQQIVRDEARVRSSQEIAFLPPLSGG